MNAETTGRGPIARFPDTEYEPVRPSRLLTAAHDRFCRFHRAVSGLTFGIKSQSRARNHKRAIWAQNAARSMS